MQWELIVALVIAIPIVIFPAAFVWWLNLGWIFFHAKEASRERRSAHENKGGEVVRAAK